MHIHASPSGERQHTYHGKLSPNIAHGDSSREEDARQPWAHKQEVRGRVAVDAVVHKQLGDEGGKDGNADAKTEAAARAVEEPPEADGHGRQRQRQLQIVGKVNLSTGVVDAHEDSNAAHDAWPFTLVCVRLTQLTVKERVQKADDGCRRGANISNQALQVRLKGSYDHSPAAVPQLGATHQADLKRLSTTSAKTMTSCWTCSRFRTSEKKTPMKKRQMPRASRRQLDMAASRKQTWWNSY